LKSKNKVLELNDEEERAFRETKLRLASPQTLAYYIPGRPVRMFTDAACTRGFGFVLQQLQPDNTWKPIQLGSRALTDAETRYAPIEAEITAITWALRQARKFLIGVPRFNIYTDHRPLVSLINNKRLEEVENMRILRNLIKCQDFNMEVHYIKGSENVAADGLSRHPVDRPEPKDYKASDKAFRHMKAINRVSALQHELSLAEEEILEVGQIDAEYTSLRDQIQQGFPESKKDLEPSLHPYWQIRHDLHVADDDLVLYGTRLVIPKALRQKIIQQLHFGHRGIVGTKNRARHTVYWPNIDSQIEQACRSCQLCEVDRPSQRKEPEIHYPTPGRCFEYLGTDLADIDGDKFLITVDWKSGWFTARSLKRSDSASIIRELREQFMCTAVPVVLFSDNGPPFNSEEFANFCRRWGIKHQTSSPYHAQSNSYAENAVKSAKSLLRKCRRNGKMDYDEWTRGILAIRNTPHASSGLSPAMILYGNQVKECLPAHKSALCRSWHEEASKLDHKIAMERQKADKYKPGHNLPPLKVGDAVIVQNRNTKRWDRYGVVQERNLNIRRYYIRLPSGMILVRNRRDIKKRYPPDNVPAAGTSLWSPMTYDDDDDDDYYARPTGETPTTETTPISTEKAHESKNTSPADTSAPKRPQEEPVIEPTPVPILVNHDRPKRNRRPPVRFRDMDWTQ
jgi:ribonuclease HI